VCGAGNAAQAFACLCSTRYKVIAFSLRTEEAEKWELVVRSRGSMECTMKQQGKVVAGRPDAITSDPSAVKNCNVVLCTVPSQSQQEYFAALEPHVKPDTIFCIMPARSGIDFLFTKIMGAKAATLGLVSFETLPWACNFNEWGALVTVLGTKDSVGAAIVPPEGKTVADVLLKVQGILGAESLIEEYPNVMSISLANPGQVMHPGIMYSKWKDWDGKPLPKRPLFYHGADEQCAAVLNGISAEIQGICRALRAISPKFDTTMVKDIFHWYTDSYALACKDTSNLQKAMATNSYYKDLYHPMKPTGETKSLPLEKQRYVPDFNFRYLSEDVPTGLVFTKGVADLLGVPAPTITEVLLWCQKVLGKEYLLPNGSAGGPDIGESRAPQAYGISTREELIKFLKLDRQTQPPQSCFAGLSRVCGR